jgi:hypothetical protein
LTDISIVTPGVSFRHDEIQDSIFRHAPVGGNP